VPEKLADFAQRRFAVDEPRYSLVDYSRRSAASTASASARSNSARDISNRPQSEQRISTASFASSRNRQVASASHRGHTSGPSSSPNLRMLNQEHAHGQFLRASYL